MLSLALSAGSNLHGAVLESHVVLSGETDASAEQVLDGSALTVEGIDDRGSVGDERSLEEVREDGQNGVEVVEVGHLGGLVLNTLHQLSNDDEIEDERRGKKRVLAGVVHGDGVGTAEEDGGDVLIHSTLGVTDVGNILDDDSVIGVLRRLVEDGVGGNHIIDDGGLGDLLGAELLLLRKVLTVIVTQVVVGNDGTRLDTSIDEEIDEDRLHLSLTRLEVITTNEDAALLSKLHDTGDEGVLGRTVDVGDTLEDRSNSEESRGRDLGLVSLDGLEQVLGSVVQTSTELREALSVSRPDDDDLVESLLLLEGADIVTEVLDDLLLVSSRDEVVGTISLVGSDEVSRVDGRQRNDVLHVGDELTLQIPVQNLGALHGISEVHSRDIPTGENDVIGVDHGDQTAEGDEDLLTVLVLADTDGGGLGQRAEVVGNLDSLLSLPGDTL